MYIIPILACIILACINMYFAISAYNHNQYVGAMIGAFTSGYFFGLMALTIGIAVIKWEKQRASKKKAQDNFPKEVRSAKSKSRNNHRNNS